MRMQPVVAVGDLKSPEGLVATVLSVVSKVHLKGLGTKVFCFVFLFFLSSFTLLPAFTVNRNGESGISGQFGNR